MGLTSDTINKIRNIEKEVLTLRAKYLKRGCEDIWISTPQADFISLDMIKIPDNRRNEGIGTDFMIELCELADKYSLTIGLYPTAEYGATLSRLINFYKRFGFIKNTYPNKDRNLKYSYPMLRIAKSEKLLESNNMSLSKKDIKIISDYVNEHKQVPDLLQIKAPNNLKYSGTAYRIIKCSKKDVSFILSGGSFKEKGKILSFAKSLEGITQVYYNFENDNPGHFKNAIVIKKNIDNNNCIIDITKFNKVYGTIHSGYSNYEDEDEVICKNDFLNISLKDVFAYHLDGKIIKNKKRVIKKEYSELVGKLLLEAFSYANVKSSNLKRIGYDPSESVLEIEFLSGGKYIYNDVPKNIFLSLKRAPSKGKYFWRKIRDVYEYERIL